MSLLQNSNAISTGGAYNLESSLRFRGGQNLTRTPSSAGNTKTYTYSMWLKRGTIGTSPYVFDVFDGTNRTLLYFNASASEALNVFNYTGGANYQVQTSASFRDPSAWYHIVVATDTTQATASDRVKIWVNGEQVTSFSATGYPPQNNNTAMNSASTMYIGSSIYSTQSFDGYITEFHSVDGQALTPSDFGEYDTTTGVWSPKKYTGTYGTNGFYLPMKETQQATGFNTVTYNGNGTELKVTGVGFNPDLVWVKRRDNAVSYHRLIDSVRGGDKRLGSNDTGGETTASTLIQSFDADGYTVGTDTGMNASGDRYVAWCWDAGSSTVSNTDGTITSSVRANPASGFSVVTYTGTGSSSATIGHGLGTTPSMIIARSRSSTQHWRVYHSSFGTTTSNTLYLNLTNAVSTTDSERISAVASDTFTVTQTTGGALNASGQNYVAYCFSEVAGYSKFGSYTGNGSTSGPTITTGFRPAFVLIKNSSSANHWLIWDNTRNPSNPINLKISPSTTTYENDPNVLGALTTNTIDFTDTGFQITGTHPMTNTSGGTYIYMAFADTRDAQFNFDASGNKNNWTPNNINSNASSETTYDIMNDVATLTDEDTANFATLNPNDKKSTLTLSEGNLRATGANASYNNAYSTMQVPKDTKIYFEVTVVNSLAGGNNLAFYLDSVVDWSRVGNNSGSWGLDVGTWSTYYTSLNGTSSNTGISISNGHVTQMAIDQASGKIWLGINNTWLSSGNPSTGANPIGTISTTADYYIRALCYNSGSIAFNFGQRPFKYTPPTGYKKLNTYNIPDSTIADGSNHFYPKLYTGTGSTLTVSGLEFSPDWVWFKQRGKADFHQAYDTVRGVAKNLSPNQTVAEQNSTTVGLTAFNSDGFTIGTWNNLNQSGIATVAWCWRGSDSSPVSNTDGTVTSTVSANTDSGFSIVTFTGNGLANATTGHGLSQAPDLIIHKQRNGTKDWLVSGYGGSALSSVFTADNQFLLLQSTSAKLTAASNTLEALPTTIKHRVNGTNTNGNTFVMYCFHSVEGFSKFGSYTGNGSADGPFVYTGFRPAFIMIKRTDTANSWAMLDVARSPYNDVDDFLYADLSDAEYANTSSDIDYLSNGFKLRSVGSAVNASGGTYIYMAFAENPFKQSLAR